MPNRRTAEQITADLLAKGSELISEAHDLSTSLTDTYKELAGVIVDLRKRFKNNEGKSDWAGRTQAYRDAVAKMYVDSGVPTDATDGMQAAIRYHIGNVLRERLTEGELKEAGLKLAGPAERSRTRNSSADRTPEDEAEWFDDTVTSLVSVAEDHPEVVIVDLRQSGGDPVPVLQEALNLLQRGHGMGVTTENGPAVQAILDQIMAEAVAFRAQTADVAAAREPARAGARR